MGIRGALVLSFAGSLVLGFLGPVPVAQGATITPTVFTDDNSNNGNCTLREAIISANTDAADDACTAGSGADQITLAAGTYELSVGPAGDDAAANGDLDITDPDGLTITGDPAGSAVDANGLDRVFHVRGGAQASFDLLTITRGNVSGSGGAISVIGGSTADVNRTTLTGNKAASEGGAIDLIGAGSTLNLSASTVAGNNTTNASGDGGGIAFQLATTVNVTNTTVSGNTAPNQGGAVEAEPGGIGSFLNSTITNNSAPDEGGSPSRATQ